MVPMRTPATKCSTCGKRYNPEFDDGCDIIEVEDVDGEMTEAPVCGGCAGPYTPPTGHYEFHRDPTGRMRRTWMED